MEHAIIYSDQDGVLADFYTHAEKILGHKWHDPNFDHIPKEERGQILNRHEGFWESIPPMPDFDTYWGYIEKYQPHILTAAPSWSHTFVEVYNGKWRWVQKHIPGFPRERFHVVQRKDKALYARVGATRNILIDDFDQNVKAFNKAGGHGILHVSAKVSILKLKALGYKL